MRNAISAGVHVSPKADDKLNGVAIRHADRQLDVATPYGGLRILNAEDGMTLLTLPDGGVREYRQRMWVEWEAIRLSRM